jgi:hypothetical protein
VRRRVYAERFQGILEGISPDLLARATASDGTTVLMVGTGSARRMNTPSGSKRIPCACSTSMTRHSFDIFASMGAPLERSQTPSVLTLR